MPLITIVIVLVVVGVALWAINTYIPMAKPVKTILNVVVVVVLCIRIKNHYAGTLKGCTRSRINRFRAPLTPTLSPRQRGEGGYFISWFSRGCTPGFGI